MKKERAIFAGALNAVFTARLMRAKVKGFGGSTLPPTNEVRSFRAAALGGSGAGGALAAVVVSAPRSTMIF